MSLFSLMVDTSFKLDLYNLSFFTTESHLFSKLSEIRPIRQVSIAKNKDGLSKGFGYAIFENENDRTAAIIALQKELIDGNRVHCEYPPIHQIDHPSPRLRSPPRQREFTSPRLHSDSTNRSQTYDLDTFPSSQEELSRPRQAAPVDGFSMSNRHSPPRPPSPRQRELSSPRLHSDSINRSQTYDLDTFPSSQEELSRSRQTAPVDGFSMSNRHSPARPPPPPSPRQRELSSPRLHSDSINRSQTCDLDTFLSSQDELSRSRQTASVSGFSPSSRQLEFTSPRLYSDSIGRSQPYDLSALVSSQSEFSRSRQTAPASGLSTSSRQLELSSPRLQSDSISRSQTYDLAALLSSREELSRSHQTGPVSGLSPASRQLSLSTPRQLEFTSPRVHSDSIGRSQPCDLATLLSSQSEFSRSRQGVPVSGLSMSNGYSQSRDVDVSVREVPKDYDRYHEREIERERRISDRELERQRDDIFEREYNRRRLG
jgi:RNA recognition motif-containing protein